MFVIQRQESLGGSRLELKLVGELDGTTDLAGAVGPISPRVSDVWVDCAGISRAISASITSWMGFFNGLTARGIWVKFIDCSEAIVNFLNVLSNFACGGQVVSVLAPFICPKCKSTEIHPVPATSIGDAMKQVKAARCIRCLGPLDFDDDPTVYFEFLSF